MSKLVSGKAVKVSLYLSDGARHHGVPVYSAVLDFLFRSDVYGASVFKGVAGFGLTHRIHTAHILEVSDRLPVKIEFLETREKVDSLLPELELRMGCGIIEVQETSVVIPAKR